MDSGSTWGFTYNALGHRAQWAHTGGADQHFFDPEGNWLGVAGGYSLVRFGERYLVAYIGSETYFNHVNALGSTSMYTNHAGTAAEDMLFYPWGDVWQSWGTGGYNFAELPFYDTNTTTELTTARIISANFGRWRVAHTCRRSLSACMRPLVMRGEESVTQVNRRHAKKRHVSATRRSRWNR